MPHAAYPNFGRPHHRAAEFLSGLARVGFTTSHEPSRRPQPGDVIVVWNRIATHEPLLRPYEAAGARVIVAENGYLPGLDGEKRYALALGHHNGAGSWPSGGPERFEALGVELRPWRSAGDRIVLLPQRGIGEMGVAMPRSWTATTLERFRRGRREVYLRNHPGQLKTEPYADLEGAHCAVTWGSGASIKALAHGVPVFHGLRSWIGAAAALQLDGADVEAPKLDDGARLSMFQRLAWAQWTMAEIVSGEAFSWLLSSSPMPRSADLLRTGSASL